MPPWGRPPGGRGGVGRYMQEAEDVYRFQELESDDDNGVLVDPGYQKFSHSDQFDPDELYFNDMDLRAWERRTGPIDGLAYGDDYGYVEDEGYYDENTGATMSQAEYEEVVFQNVLDKIRFARATGEPDVQLSPEELDIYRSRLLRPRAPAVRPQATARPVSAPVTAGASSAVVNASTKASGSGSGSTRASKSKQRTSIFAPRPKKDKPSGRKRAPSTVSESAKQPPGFVVQSSSGQPVFAPINAYNDRIARDPIRATGSVPSSRPPSRSASINSRQAQTPPRITPPRDIPGAFPSGSPQRYYRDNTPPRQTGPVSSSSRQSSTHGYADWQPPPESRSRSSSIQQPSKLVPFPVADYQHYTAEPYQYHSPGQSASSPSSSQPGSARRVVSGLPDGKYMTMPRRVPVPVQRAAAPMSGIQGSISDPALGRRGSGLRGEVSDEDDGLGGVMVDVIPQADERSYKVQTVKSSGKESSSSGKDSERKRRSARSRRKN